MVIYFYIFCLLAFDILAQLISVLERSGKSKKK